MPVQWLTLHTERTNFTPTIFGEVTADEYRNTPAKQLQRKIDMLGAKEPRNPDVKPDFSVDEFCNYFSNVISGDDCAFG